MESEMEACPSALQKLIEELMKLPGIGRRSAERIAMHILRMRSEEAQALAQAIKEASTNILECPICHNITDRTPCAICSDTRRDHTQLLVVEQPRDLLAIESSGWYRGIYHVLGGRLSPMENIEADDLTIDHLIRRVREGKIKEVIVFTNPDFEGEATAHHIAELLKSLGVEVTLPARGIAPGSQIEYAGKTSIRDALRGRVKL